MTRTSFKDFPCSMARTADIIGDKWTLLILRDAFFGASTFSQFQKSLGVARNILSDRLDKLVQFGVLDKQPVRPGVERYTYTLTERGQDLTPVLIAITQWGDRWTFGEGKAPVQFYEKDSDTPIRAVEVQSSEGRPLRAQDITARFRSKTQQS
jgi:DNA-binding HxlR family transcriptional regulator